MTDVLKIIKDLADRLWAQYGDVLKMPKTQEEVHMTYYVGRLMDERGHEWFKSPGVEGACYTEKALHDAFTAGRRIGYKEGLDKADEIVAERIQVACNALNGRDW